MEEFNHGKIEQVNISKEMRTSFLEYSMSVIISRALPDVRDGMKPVHRRILYALHDLGMTPNKPHRKSAHIVGDVMGKYHPHGDSAIYEAMVRMAQPFSYRYPLVDGHGNFGNIDGDSAAAMRYTEARMSKISLKMVQDIDEETIDWMDTYDGETVEPTVLPSRFPNLLVNGSMGIAVGMATNIPPHNLTETINATIAVMENPEISVVELMDKYISGPDFPTGGYILGRAGIKQAFETGRGSVVMRAKAEIVEEGPKKKIVITEIPYQVNKQNLVAKIAELHRDKLVEGITDINDYSNMSGIKIVIDLRRDTQPEVILNQLYRLTPLQCVFGVNTVVIVGQTPMLLPLKQMLSYYALHQEDVVRRRTAFRLRKAEERAHILEGFKIALDHIDAILNTIRASKDNNEALAALIANFGLDEEQAKAILEMQFKRLTGMERDKILAELNVLLEQIADYKDILAKPERVISIVKDELIAIRDEFGDERKTEIIDGGTDVLDEDLIPVENVIISMTVNGYIKRIPVDTYKSQNRGGKGIKGMNVNEDDVVDKLITMSTHDNLLLFSNSGKVYRIKGYNIPEASRTSKGLPLVNIIPLEKEEKIKSLVSYAKDDDHTKYLFFVTKNGLVKRTQVEEFESIRTSGKIAIQLRDNDELVEVKGTSGNDEIIIGASNGKAVRFNEDDVRSMGRTATGVKGMALKDAEIIGMTTDREGSKILVVSEHGYGKMSTIDEYRKTQRGTTGVKTINATEKTGQLIAIKAVNGNEDCLIMTTEGILIRFSLENVATSGRVAQGVRLIKLAENTYVKTITITEKSEETEIKEDEEATE